MPRKLNYIPGNTYGPHNLLLVKRSDRVDKYGKGEPIRRFKGTYNVEFFNNKYIVIMNQHTGERVNVYGNSTIVIDESS